MVPGGSSQARRARASARISAAHCRSAAGIALARARLRATLKAKRGLSRSIHVLEGEPGLVAAAGCAAPAPRPTGPGGARRSSRTSPTSAASVAHHRLQRRGGLRHRRSRRRRRRPRAWSAGSPGSARRAAPPRRGRRSRRRARTSPSCRRSAPAASCRRDRAGRGSGGCRRGRRSSPARAPSRRCRCRARCRTAPGATAEAEPDDEPPGTRLGRPRIERRAVEGVLAEDAERHLVGDGLADQGRAGIEQPLHGPGVARRDRILPRPVRVAAAGRMPGDVEQILGGEGQAGERTVRRTGDAQAGRRRTGSSR